MSAFWHWSMAWRYTRSSASDRLVSFMSLVSISGLVLGVAVLVLVLSVMNGFEQELRVRVLGVLPHGILYTEGGFADWRTAAGEFAAQPEVLASAPFAESSGLVVAGSEVAGVQFYGIDPAAEAGVSIIGDFIVSGSLASLTPASFHVAIGATLASKLDVTLGDKVTLVLPDVQLTLAGPLPRTRRFEVTAVFAVGSDADKAQLLVNIDDANRLRRVDRIDGIRLRFRDLFDADAVLAKIVRESDDPNLYAASWTRRHGNLYDAIQVQKSTMFLLLLTLVAVASFNVVSNLVMTVDDRRGDIAILRTLGASPRSILGIFIMHGAIVGAVGILLGVCLGVVLSLNLGELYSALDSRLHLGLMDEYFIHYLPSKVLLTDVITITLVSMLICLLATIYPAWRASEVHPVEALQYDA